MNYQTCKDIFSNFFKLPKLTLSLNDRSLYVHFNKRHRLLIIPNKRIGVALLQLPSVSGEYLVGSSRQALRTNCRKAERAGLSFAVIENPIDYLSDVMAIHNSMPVRQGRKMDTAYTNHEQVSQYLTTHKPVYGVIDVQNRLHGYLDLLYAGEVAVINRLLGHRDALDLGVMYLLMAGVVEDAVTAKNKTGFPIYLMYDTYFGAAPGLRYFKDRTGFKPYKVSWRLV